MFSYHQIAKSDRKRVAWSAAALCTQQFHEPLWSYLLPVPFLRARLPVIFLYRNEHLWRSLRLARYEEVSAATSVQRSGRRPSYFQNSTGEQACIESAIESDGSQPGAQQDLRSSSGW